MAKLTMIYGGLLILLGVVSYQLTGGASKTALIPSFFGVPIAALGVLAHLNDANRKHLMHAAMGLSLLGLLGTIRALPFGLYLISVGPTHVDNAGAVAAQSIMAVLSAGYLYLGIRSFIQARKNKTAEPATDPAASIASGTD